MTAEDSDAKARRRNTDPGGEPRGFIGATDARRATVRLDLRAYHVHRCVTSQDTRPRSLSFPTKTMLDGSPSQVDRTLSPQRGYGSECFVSGPPGPGTSRDRPNSLDDRPNRGWAHKQPGPRYTSIGRAPIRSRALARLTLDKIPMNGTPGFP